MNIESLEWTSTQPIAEHYLRSFDKVEPLYEYAPFAEESWTRRAEWLDRTSQKPGYRVERSRLVEALLQFHERIDGDEASARSIRSLADPRTLTIVGGQQAGLLTGQLLVIYKAVTLLQTARQAEQELGRPVVPVFWIAGEDHDFDEVNHIVQLSNDLQQEKLKLDHPNGRRNAVSRLPISAEAWSQLLGQLDSSLMQTEFKADLMAKLHEIAAKSLTMVDFFARMLVWLFRDTGLILMDSDDLTIRELEGPMFETLIARHVDIQKRVEESAERVRELGYTPQHELQPNMANLFVFDEGERVLLYADRSNEDGFTDRRGTRKYSRMKLMDWAKSSPDRLSNNVMTRPLMQDYLFPVLGAVLGPGEIAYWGLTRESFRELGMQMPILVPRLEFSLVEGTIAKNMLKYGLIFDDVIHRLEQRKQEWLAGQDTLHLDERFRQVKEQFRESYASILETIATINPGLKKLGDTNMTKIIEQIDFLEQKAADGYRTQFDSSLRHWNRIGLSLLPGGRPQERVYNVVVFLNKYGSDWIGKLLESPIAPDGNHRIVYM